ncbi:MAG: metal-sensitive transcriptional regulator [Clostridia bacterium]|nr:metal-sensitive transcriptional regulator [Clostridia bacterium]
MELNREEMINRLKKIEGQVRGISKMLEEERYCVDVLLQISAARSGLHKIGLALLQNHTKGCVTKAFQEERGDEAVKELIMVLDRFTK